MIKRVPRFAETKFANLCAVSGVLCHHAEEDESGWDFFVEFPVQPLAPPADTHPPPKTAFVQVKSTRKCPLVCRVKLSNMLRAVRSPQPWFLVLMIADATHEPTGIYAVHVWSDLIRRTLEAVRRAENNKTALNKRTLTIRFDAADKRDDHLVPWMLDEIEAIGCDYEQQKKGVFQTIGYEDGYGMAQVSFEATTVEKLLENFLGLGGGIPLSRFTFTPCRFGIPSPEPLIDEHSGIIHITPSPAGTCEIRLRGPGTSPPIVLPGQVYSLGIPALPLELRRLRFSADSLDVIWAPQGQCGFRLDLDRDEKKDLLSIENFATLVEWCEKGPLDVQIWSDSQRLTGGTVTLDVPNRDLDWTRVAAIVRLLRSIARSVETSQIRLSLADLISAERDLVAFQVLVEAPSVRLGFEPLPDAPPEFSSLVYYSYADVCGLTFYALVERPVSEDILIERRRRVTCGMPKLIEGYALRDATEDQRKVMDHDYERHLQRLKQAGTPLGLGDSRVFLEATQHDETGPERVRLPDTPRART